MGIFEAIEGSIDRSEQWLERWTQSGWIWVFVGLAIFILLLVIFKG